jgi:hypothetical protein
MIGSMDWDRCMGKQWVRTEHPGRSAIVYAVASDEAARKIAGIENFMVP